MRRRVTGISRRLTLDSERQRLRSDVGDTLVEVLIALVVIGLTVTALLGAFATSFVAAGQQRGLATIDTVVKSYVETAIFEIENQHYNGTTTQPIFAACGTASTDYYTNAIANGTGDNGTVLYTPPTNYSARITAIQYWNGSMFVGSCTVGSSTDLNPQQLTATVTAPNGTQASLNFVVSNPAVPAGPASQMFVTEQPPSTIGAGTAFPVDVIVEDSLGHLVTNATESVSLNITTGTGTSGAALSCTTDPISVSNGNADFNCSINLAGSGYTLTASTSGLTSVTTSSIMVNPGAPSQLVFNPSTPGGGLAVAANPIPSVSVEVEDASGNVISTAGGSVTMTIASGTDTSFMAGSSTTVNVVNGIADFSSPGYLQVNDAGTYQFTATPSGITGVTAVTSTAFTIAPGPNTVKLVFTNQPGGGANGAPWSSTAQPQVSIENQMGTVQTSNTTPITLSIFSQPSTGAGLSCQTSGDPETPTTGVATFAGCEITGTVGNYVLAASAPGIATVHSSLLAITVGSPAQLVFGAPANAFSVRAGHRFSSANQPVVQILDSGGNLTSSTATVTLTLVNNTSGATLTCNSNSRSVNASGGIATFSSCSIDTAQSSPYALSASASSLALTSQNNSDAITVTP